MKVNAITETLRRELRHGKRIFNLISGNPVEQGFPFPSAPLEESYRNYFHHPHYRPDPKGEHAARAAVAAYYAERGAHVDPEHILLTAGTSESFFFLFSLLTAAGDNVLVPNPSYPLFDEIARLAHITLTPYPLREETGWHVDLHELERRINHRTRALCLISPHNPTGSVFTTRELERIATIATKHHLAIIADEVFSEFLFTSAPFPRLSAMAPPPLLFTLNGIAKMFALPGMKLGWITVTGDDRLVAPAVDRLETICDTFLATHLPIQLALPDIFRAGSAFRNQYVREVAARREIALDIIARSQRLQCHAPAGGFYLTARIDGMEHDQEEAFVIRLIEEAGVSVHPGFFYDIESGAHIVISFLTKRDELRGGLERLGAALLDPAVLCKLRLH